LAFALHHLRRRTFRLTPALPGSADRPQAALLEVMHSARSFDCLFVHDKGLILEVNEATSAVFGYARTELPGKNITTLFSADSRALVSESVLLGNFRSIECTCVRQNGDTFQAELFSKKASCEDHDLMVTTIRDISDRKRLESTLDKERRQLQMFYQRQAALTDIQKAIDQRGEMPPVLNQIAQVAAQFLPASIGSCLLLRDIDTGQLQIAASCFRSQGAPTDPPQEFHPGTATQWILDHRESLVISQKGSDPFGIAQVFPGLDTQAYAGIPIFSAGIIAGMLFVLDHQLRAFGKEDLDFLTNLTVKAGTALVLVHLSESLHQTSSKLEQQRSEWEKTRADLAQAKDKAEAANHFKSAFLQQAGQALRVPLSGIMSMTNLLLLSSLPDESRQIVETLRDAAQLLLSRLNAVSDFVQILSGNLRIKVLDFDLSEVLKGTIKNHLALAQKKHLELQVHLADPIPRSLRGDAARLEQVLSELMTNAVKFTERGQIEIRVTRVSTDSPKIRLRFEVRDTGPGIAPANQVKLFQPFAVIGDPNTHPDSGMRLGLALSRHLVELMDGQMGVQSEPGAGSTFWFTVSLQEATIIKP
jgi:PAS domain S-box-containing protein